MFDLTKAWEDGVLPDILNERKLREGKETQSLSVPQSSFQFDVPPRVVFVKDLHTRKAVTVYGDLPTVPLQPEEKKIYRETLIQQGENPKFYNGHHILLTGVVYDTATNTIYLEAVRVRYAFLVALTKMKAICAQGSVLQHKVFFKTGVLAPFISKDQKVPIITRRDKLQLRSVASGFLECFDKASVLAGLVPITARKEADEECALDRFGHRRLDFVGFPAITSISFREGISKGTLPTIEFVAPIKVGQDAGFILSVLNSNEAPDADDHLPDSAVIVPVAADEREAASRFMRQRLPGDFLYGPVLHACAAGVDSERRLASRIPELSDSRFHSMMMFKPAPEKPVPDSSVAEKVRYIK